jgi:SAM-dependent methyltransferase
VPTAAYTASVDAMSIAMSIEYDHQNNIHSEEGAVFALSRIFPDRLPESIIDVGCGEGMWLKAAADRGVVDIVGVDGVPISRASCRFPYEKFVCHDLSKPFNLGRKFDLAICLEVGEHLDPEDASTLVINITRHADTVLFSAACPDQPGQHHVNCQWPEYWQDIFNAFGFRCTDTVRWSIWNDQRIEPWYRQNLLWAQRNGGAGREQRIAPVLHPQIAALIADSQIRGAESALLHRLRSGTMPVLWYASALMRSLRKRLKPR